MEGPRASQKYLTPPWNWSVFDALMLRLKARLPPWLVSTTSANDRCVLGLKPASSGEKFSAREETKEFYTACSPISS